MLHELPLARRVVHDREKLDEAVLDHLLGDLEGIGTGQFAAQMDAVIGAQHAGSSRRDDGARQLIVRFVHLGGLRSRTSRRGGHRRRW